MQGSNKTIAESKSWLKGYLANSTNRFICIFQIHFYLNQLFRATIFFVDIVCHPTIFKTKMVSYEAFMSFQEFMNSQIYTLGLESVHQFWKSMFASLYQQLNTKCKIPIFFCKIRKKKTQPGLFSFQLATTSQIKTKMFGISYLVSSQLLLQWK